MGDGLAAWLDRTVGLWNNRVVRLVPVGLVAFLLTQVPSGAGRTPVAGSAAAPDAPGPAVGATLPGFEAADQDGRRRTFESLRGKNGLLLVFSRSADW